MNRICLIFDYFKEAYHLNKNNKSLYKPQIALIFVKLLMIIAIGIRVYTWINDPVMRLAGPDTIFNIILPYIGIFFIMLLAYGIISVIFESGLYNMYKKCVLSGATEKGDFGEGIRKYFFKFFWGNILIILAWIIILPFYLIAGIVTLTVGLSVIPLIISIFLTMWKISLVINDSRIFKSIKDSFSFAKTSFLPLATLQLIHWAFIKGSASSSGSYSYNFNNFNNLQNMPISNTINQEEIIDTAIKVVKILLAILVPVITIATLLGSLVKMVFEVFFALVLFIAYDKKFRIPEPDIEPANEPMIEAYESNEEVPNHVV